MALLEMFEDKLLAIGNRDTVYNNDTTTKASPVNNNSDKAAMVASTSNTSKNKSDSEQIN